MGRTGEWRARATGLAVLTACIVGALFGGVTAAASSPRPACTRSALQAGLARGSDPVAHARVAHPFGCAGGWAYAAVNTPRFTLTSVFQARGGRWVTASRGRACSRGQIPRRIRKPACESN